MFTRITLRNYEHEKEGGLKAIAASSLQSANQIWDTWYLRRPGPSISLVDINYLTKMKNVSIFFDESIIFYDVIGKIQSSIIVPINSWCFSDQYSRHRFWVKSVRNSKPCSSEFVKRSVGQKIIQAVPSLAIYFVWRWAHIKCPPWNWDLSTLNHYPSAAQPYFYISVSSEIFD